MSKRMGVRQWIALNLFRKLRQIRRDEHVLNTSISCSRIARQICRSAR